MIDGICRLLFLIAFLMPSDVMSDVLYFWLDNDDMMYQNMVGVADSFYAVVSWNDQSKEVAVQSTKRSVTEFDHTETGKKGNKTTVYKIDLGNIKISERSAPAYSFALEMTLSPDRDQAEWAAEWLESDIWTPTLLNWRIDTHICAGVTMHPVVVPEPDGFGLLFLGFATILLRRRRHRH